MRYTFRCMASQRPVNRILLNMCIDGGLAAMAAPVARWVADPGGGWLHPFWFLAGGAITLLLAGLPFRLPQQYWRFSGISDLVAVAGGSVVSAILFSALVRGSGYPLPSPTFPVIHTLVLFVFLGLPRVIYRLYQARPQDLPANQAQNILLVGADEGADLFLRAIGQDRQHAYRVIGLLALAARQAGRRIQGHPILGTSQDVPEVLARLRAENRLPSALVITDPDLAGTRLAELLEVAHAQGVPVRRAPRPTALAEAGKATLELRPVAIEDLLNRPQVPLDRAGMARMVQGRRVLVTGAGGTIGSELARQVAALNPSQLVLLDSGEFALWRIDLELSENHPTLPRAAVIADVRDANRIGEVFATWQPELVFHAAALKHVPIVEANPLEGVLTNVIGTRNVADAARAAGTSAMVLISTDKAVNPSSLMGASKRLAEMYCQALDITAQKNAEQVQDGLRCITVRFGNVLGSTGSVVPLFRRQLERGGPLTVTHPDMRRYFMTVREAVGLVLQASVLGLSGAQLPGGRQGGIFVLDMGEPVKIVDLARQMIRLAGLEPERDIAIHFTGLRPGEKLFEELFHGKEPPEPTGSAGLLMAAPRTADLGPVGQAIATLDQACRNGHTETALALLSRMVPEFIHQPEGDAQSLPPEQEIAHP